ASLAGQAPELVECELEQLVLVRHMPVQAGGACAEACAEFAHAQRLEAFFVQQRDRCLHDLIPGQARRPRLPGCAGPYGVELLGHESILARLAQCSIWSYSVRVESNTVRDPRRWLILAALCLSLLVLMIDSTVLNIAIPSLIRELDA